MQRMPSVPPGQNFALRPTGNWHPCLATHPAKLTFTHATAHAVLPALA